ncbi:MAG TPA: type VI secretion system protein TssA, partial [Holophaga sp.]|nr:type VI secretion system protein TssA [Holophaga sp.]
ALNEFFTIEPAMLPTRLETFLAPIATDRPGGTDVGPSPDCDAIRRLRQGDDPQLSQGEWVREIRTPQWAQVRDICERILEGRSKDLRVVCWYVEALAHMEGFPGIAFGLDLIEGLLDRYWAADPPALFPVDPDERIARLEWLDDDRQLPTVVNSLAMTAAETGGLSRAKWEESRQVENLGLRDPQAREQAIAEGKLPAESWEKAVIASGPGFCLRLAGQIREALSSLEALASRVDGYCGAEAPPMGNLREALEGCARLSEQMLQGFGHGAGRAPSVSRRQEEASPVPPAGIIHERAEALRWLREGARYFRDHEPHSPVGPLAERAARWGEMPLDQWLGKVIKDEQTLAQLRELLDLQALP